MLIKELDLGTLELFGKILDCHPGKGRRGSEQVTGDLWKPTLRDVLIEQWLRIRVKTGGQTLFKLNRAQREYSRMCSKKNVVLKARQLGITTYIAARLFVQTITRRGTLSVQVAQDREAAEQIFQIVHRFWNELPPELKTGLLRTSHCNARQLVFPKLDSEYCVASAEENAGRGWTIQNLHCSEVSRWVRGGEEALAELASSLSMMDSTSSIAMSIFSGLRSGSVMIHKR